MIEFESVGKTYRGGKVAVADLTLTVPTGQLTVIVGPPGSGKTTALRMVNRLIEPSTGRISLNGAPLRSRRKKTLRRETGYVTRGGGLLPHRTVLDNVGTVLGLLGWSRSRMDRRGLELLDQVGLDRRLAHRYPDQLGAGQTQRVGLARALAGSPGVLLMDEPFAAVDGAARTELQDLLLDLRRRSGQTILLLTHDIDEAIKLGDRVAILRSGGTLAQVGTPRQVLDQPADAFVAGFLGRDRGYRLLSFQLAGSLPVDRVRVVRDVIAGAGDEPTLVVDGEAKPLGWVDPAGTGSMIPIGSTFRPTSDTLRTALDSALTSPFGLAVAVEPGTGRYAGVVSARTILDQVQGARSGSAVPIPVGDRSAGADPDGTDALTTVRPPRPVPPVPAPDLDETRLRPTPPAPRPTREAAEAEPAAAEAEVETAVDRDHPAGDAPEPGTPEPGEPR